MTEKRWSFSGGVIVGTDICEKGIPHTNRSIVTHLNRYERKIKELEEENEKLKKMGKVSLKDAQLLAKGHKRYRKIIESLKEENEQLKERIEALEDANTGLVETIAHFDIEEVMR